MTAPRSRTGLLCLNAPVAAIDAGPRRERRRGCLRRAQRVRADQEYGELCRGLVGRLARKRPSPLMRGRPEICAAGVIYTIGSLNFLFDRS